ncbi:MAG: hypothetical protein ACK5IF_02220, partial [Ignavibacteria bacterium]
MNHIPFLLRILALYFCFSTLHAQKPLIMIPEKPLQGDSITIFFHAERGNAVLSNINGDVYIHSGVITQKSPTNTSWQHVRGEWGKPNGEFRMTKEAENVYSFRMHPKSFY